MSPLALCYKPYSVHVYTVISLKCLLSYGVPFVSKFKFMRILLKLYRKCLVLA